MRQLLTLLFILSFHLSFGQTVEIFQTLGQNAEIHMTPDPAGGANIINMFKNQEFDRSLWRLIYEKNDLLPPMGPIEFAWEVGLGTGFGIDPDFFGIGRYDFNIDFIFKRAALVIDNQTLFTGINDDTPNARLHVYNLDNFDPSQVPATLVGEFPGTQFQYGYFTVDQPDDDDNSNIARFRDDGITQVAINRGSATYQLTVSGDAFASGVWMTSDQKLKKQIQGIDGSLASLRKLRPTSYYFKDDQESRPNLPEEQQFGFLAQDVALVFPNLVRKTEDRNEEGEVIGTIQSLNYIGLIPILVSSIQEMDGLLSERSYQLAEMKSQNENLQSRLERLEALVAELMDK